MVSGHAIAVQGIGYGPQAVATQGFQYTSVVVETPATIGGGGGLGWVGNWFTRNPRPRPKVLQSIAKPKPRTGVWASVIQPQAIAIPQGKSRLVVAIPSTVQEAQVSSPSGWSRVVRMGPSVDYLSRVGVPQGRNDTTRIDEEFLAIILADEDSLDDYT